jgi:septal ring factor EnvC (AmiA/AmiB activator)
MRSMIREPNQRPRATSTLVPLTAREKRFRAHEAKVSAQKAEAKRHRAANRRQVERDRAAARASAQVQQRTDAPMQMDASGHFWVWR